MLDFKKEILGTIKNGDEYPKEYKDMFEENQKLLDEWDKIFKEEEKFKF